MPPRKIIVSGATGFIGVPLVEALKARGDEVVILTRGDSGEGRVHWDPSAGEIDFSAIQGADAVVHLAGEPLTGVWTAAKKERILESRRKGTMTLASAVASLKEKPKAFVSSSAVGYYGDRGDELLNERSGCGEGFLAEVVRKWEDAAHPARDAGIRTVALRIGLVIGPRGGVVGAVKPLFKLGAGGPLGRGEHWWSWVSRDDVVRAFVFALDYSRVDGEYNVVAPDPVTNAQFTKALARVLRRPAILPAPRFALRLAMRDMADEMLLSSQRVDSGKYREAGFAFEDIDLEAVLKGAV